MTVRAWRAMTPPSVVYIVPDKMGGMMNIIANLLAYRRPDGFSYHVVLTHNHLNDRCPVRAAAGLRQPDDGRYTLPIENLHAVMRRLAAAVPTGPGVVVAGDLLDLAMLSVTDVGRAVVLILHGDDDYYYDLAVKHDRVVHAYVAYSRRMYEQLLAHLPHRAGSIHYIPYGIPLPRACAAPAAGPLRLIFAGRLEHGQKGVLELPAIAAGLRDRSIDATWTIIGDGPDGATLRAAWPESASVRYLGPLTNADTIERLADHDVFVLPTRVEGLPVALLEAMGCGVVPVVSNIDSGVPDVVTAGVNGLLPEVGDVDGFADAIARLDGDRPLLERMSAAGRRVVEERFDVRDRMAEYQALYARYAELYRPLAADAALQYGSRLDQPVDSQSRSSAWCDRRCEPNRDERAARQRAVDDVQPRRVPGAGIESVLAQTFADFELLDPRRLLDRPDAWRSLAPTNASIRASAWSSTSATSVTSATATAPPNWRAAVAAQVPRLGRFDVSALPGGDGVDDAVRAAGRRSGCRAGARGRAARVRCCSRRAWRTSGSFLATACSCAGRPARLFRTEVFRQLGGFVD